MTPREWVWGRALGYQQMRVGRHGRCDFAERTFRAPFVALTLATAKAVIGEVTRVVAGWRAHFAEKGVSQRDFDLPAEQIDRAFLLEQRVPAG